MKKNGTIIIYTDGACSGNQNSSNVGGWGAVFKYGKHKLELCGGEKNTTNNRMEMTGVIKALERLKRKDLPVRLHTDSAYVCNCLNQKWYQGWRKNGWKNARKQPVENKELWIRLLELYESMEDIEIIKVKGHAGVPMNEKADELANKGMDEIRCSDM